MSRSNTRRSPRRISGTQFSTYAWAIRAEGNIRRKSISGDYVLFSLAADAAEQNNAEVLRFLLAWADTEPRDAILEHIHPSLYSKIGFTPLNIETSINRFTQDHSGWQSHVAGRTDIVKAYRELLERNEQARYR